MQTTTETRSRFPIAKETARRITMSSGGLGADFYGTARAALDLHHSTGKAVEFKFNYTTIVITNLTVVCRNGYGWSFVPMPATEQTMFWPYSEVNRKHEEAVSLHLRHQKQANRVRLQKHINRLAKMSLRADNHNVRRLRQMARWFARLDLLLFLADQKMPENTLDVFKGLGLTPGMCPRLEGETFEEHLTRVGTKGMLYYFIGLCLWDLQEWEIVAGVSEEFEVIGVKSYTTRSPRNEHK